MYATGLPLMMFITDDDCDRGFEVGECYFVLDSEFDWFRFIRKHPLAFCVGCAAEQVSAKAELFKELGFAVIEENPATSVGSFIARNKEFMTHFERALEFQEYSRRA